MTYRDMFFAVWGSGPWPCCFCGDDVEIVVVHIHHINGDHADDRCANLAPIHPSCHKRHHDRAKPRARMQRKPMTDETRRRISEAHRVSPKAAEARKLVIASNRGSKRTDAARARMSASGKAKAKPTDATRLALSEAARKRPFRTYSDEARANMAAGQQRRRSRERST